MARTPSNSRRNDAPPPTTNEVISLQEKLHFVLKQLRVREEEVAAVLPSDVTFENFYATVNQALRNNPDVLKATPISIVNACVKAAYDGLRPDGREAAIVTHNVKIKGRGGERDAYETQAQYFPMVFGLIQQILRGGEVLSIEAEVVYENDYYDIQRGTDAKIVHQPIMDDNPGEMLFAYTVATLKSGIKTTAYLRKHEILDVMMASKSGVDDQGKPKGVWRRWPRQMWLKTVLRFHRKTLPLGDRQIADMEQADLFPDMQQRENPLGLSAPPPRPTRRQHEALENRSGEGNGVSMDFGNQPEVEEVQRQPADQARKVEGREAQVDQSRPKPAAKSTEPMPVGDEEWTAWVQDLSARVMAATKPAVINEIASAERERIAAASKERRDYVNGLITDALADLASDATTGPAPGESDDNDGPGV